MAVQSDNLFNHELQNKDMQKSLVQSIKEVFPIKAQGKTLILNEIKINDTLDSDDFPQQKEVKLNRGSWQLPIYGDFSIVDDRGGIIDTVKNVKIGNIPKLTNRFTAIIDGNEYQTVNQIRRKSGVYSRIKKNGELESEFNLAKGANFKMQLDPISQIFYLIFSNRKFRLWTLLNTINIPDSEIVKYWGRELLEINKAKALNTEVSELTAIYKKLYGKDAKNFEEVQNGLRSYYDVGSDSTEMNGDVNKITLGEEFDKVTGYTLLAASKKLLNINKGKSEPDERDSLIYKQIYAVNDLVKTFFEKQAPVIKQKLKRTLDRKSTVKEIVSSSTFGEPIKRFFTVGDLSSTPAQTNPVMIAAEWRKTTPMGQGGIQSSHAITMDTRDVQPTHLGFIDSLATPECLLPETQILTKTGWKNSDEITLKDELAALIENKLSFQFPSRVLSYNYDGVLYGVESSDVEYLVTPEHKVLNNNRLLSAKEAYGLDLVLRTGLCDEQTAVISKTDHFMKEYKGPVYCVTVPGSVIYIKHNNKTHWTGNSGKVGINLGLASEVKKVGNDMKTPVLDYAGNKKWLSPTEFYAKNIGFPDQFKVVDNKPVARYPMVNVMSAGVIKKVPSDKVDFYIAFPRAMFSFQENLIPFLANTQGNRASTGARMITQALALDNPDVPYVQTVRDKNTTYQQALAQYLIPEIKIAGKVKSIDSKYMLIEGADGKEQRIGLYDNFPLNQDGYLNAVPNFKVGDTVKPGDLPFNHTYSKDGVLALGKNLRTAFMSYKGYTFEDGVVISKSAAEKLSHSTIHKVNIYFSPKLAVFNKKKFNAWFPDEMTQENFNKLDDEGIIKIGETVNPNDVIGAFLIEKEMDDIDSALKKLNKTTFNTFSKSISIWDEEDSGVVTDVRKVGRNIDIYIKARHPFKEGDKLSGSFGNKGIVTKIIEDDEAPRTADGKIVEVIMSPEGVPGRMNLGQILETAAGKIAEKTGKPYLVNNFEDPDSDAAKKVLNEMKALNIPVNEVLYDGKTGKPLGKEIFLGNQYIYKLRHIVKKKEGMHAYGTYDMDETPVGKGVQKVGILDTYAYLAHGAKKLLSEANEIKGRKNDEYWRDLQFGIPPGKPARNFVFEKFVNYLKGAGINVEKTGNQLRILPLTDKDVLEMSNGAIKDGGAMLIGKNLASRKEGLFDPNTTGGVRGTKWAHLELKERIPNPMYEEAIMKALDLTEQGYKDIIQFKKEVDGKKGPAAIVSALEKMDYSLKLELMKEELKTAPPTNVNKLNTKIKYLSALKDLNLTPVDAYTTKLIPVIPPVFRPIYPLPSGDLRVNDMNHHYRAIALLNKGLENEDLPDDKKAKGLVELYNSIKAMQGLAEATDFNQKKYKGILNIVGTMKTGLIQGQAWTRKQDLSARSTITTEPDLNLDEVGIPKEMAFTVYKPFVISELKTMGLKATDALKNYEERTDLASNALLSVIKNRPILLNRAPSLHKHSVQAFRPQITEGKSIKLNPLIVSGLNADFDGDEQINSVYINLLDNDVENYYISVLKYNRDWFNQRRVEMASRLNVQLPIVEGGNYYIVNLEDFPFNQDKLIGKKEHISFYEAEKFIKVVAYDEKENKFVLAHVSGWSRHEDRVVWTVTLQNKQQIITDDDPRAVYGITPGTLELTRKKPSEAKGMLVPVATDLTKIEMKKFEYLTGTGVLNSSIFLSKRIGYILGALVGDGWITTAANSSPNRVSFSNTEKNIINQFKDYVSDFFKETPHIGHTVSTDSYGHSESWIISSVDFAKLVYEAIGKGANNKHLPPYWALGSTEFKLGLLSGLLDTDGTVAISHGKEKPQLQYSYTSNSIRLVQEIQQMLLTLGVKSRISFSKTTVANNTSWLLSMSSIDMKKLRNLLNTAHAKNREAMFNDAAQPDEDSPSAVKNDLVPIDNTTALKMLSKISAKRNTPKEEKCDYTMLRKSLKSGYLSRYTAKRLYEKYNPEDVDGWLAILNNLSVTWQPVVAVENTGKEETGYDLTVPGYETFMSVDGIILSNTMSVQIPVTNEGVQEAKNMFPSKILFKHGDNKLVPGLSKDFTYGVYKLSTITGKSNKEFNSINEAKAAKLEPTVEFSLKGKPMTIGRWLLNAPLPDALKNYETVFSGKVVGNLLDKVSREHTNYFPDVINAWKGLGASQAYTAGHTISLTDIAVDHGFRDKIINEEMPKIDKLKGDAKIDALNELTRKVEAAQGNSIKNTNLVDMLESGSFTKKDSVRQIINMPGVLTDVRGNPVELPVLRSYAEGLDLASYWTSLYGVRKGTVDRAVNTQESGALNKALLSVNRRVLITIEDCGTDEGLKFPLNSKDIMDRSLLNTVRGVGKRNDIINSEVILNARNSNITELNVRSPLTCEAPNGICQRCYGLLPNGELPPIGTNVGVLDSEAVTERATQLGMRTFHCFHPGNVVFTKDNELRTIEDIVNSGYDGEILDKNNTWTKIKKAWSHEVQGDVRLLKTKLGHGFIAQDNHPVLVTDSFQAARDRDYEKLVIKEVKDLALKKDCFIPEDFPNVMGTRVWDLEISPYDLGIYLIETAGKPHQLESIRNLCGTDYLNKRMPPQILQYSEDDLKEMISGMVDGASHITHEHNEHTVFIILGSYALVVQLNIILRLLKITSRYDIRDYVTRLKYYTLMVINKSTPEILPNCKTLKRSRVSLSKRKYDYNVYPNTLLSSRIINYTHPVVYDIETESSTLVVNGLLLHNSGGTALAKGGITEGFKRMEQLLKVPDKLAGKAPLVEESGSITNITKSPTGGWVITVNTKKYVIPPGLAPTVSIGQFINKGDALSEGVLKPQELSAFRNHLDAQQYIVDEMDKVYEKGFKKKTFETVVRGISDNAVITEAPDDSGFLRGDKSTISYLKYLNKQRASAGLQLIKYEPYFKSVDTLNTDSDDWLTRITTNRVKAGLQVGAAKALYSDIRGKDPIPSYIVGEDFGKGEFY